MTDKKKQRLENMILESRGRLMEKYPFFAILLMYLKFVTVKNLKKVSTNGRCIFFCPEFIEKLRPSELDYLLCHQVLHIINGDIWRGEEWKGDTYHFACDIKAANTLKLLKFDTKFFTRLGYLYDKIPAGSQENVSILTPKEIYDRLPYDLEYLDEYTRKKMLLDSDAYWDDKENEGQGGEVIVDALLDIDAENLKLGSPVSSKENKQGNGDDEKEENFKASWNQKITSAVETVKNQREKNGEKGCGNIPGYIMERIGANEKASVDWRKILANFLQENVCDYSFSPPDRRYIDGDFFLPDFNAIEYSIRDVLFMVDTSGSIDRNDLVNVYTEIKGVTEQFSGCFAGKIGFFDTEVKGSLVDFCSKQELLNILPVGGGGTSFYCIFKYLANAYKKTLPCCVIIFTDGGAEFPENNPLKIPVLWAINNELITPPWGKVIRIPSSTTNGC